MTTRSAAFEKMGKKEQDTKEKKTAMMIDKNMLTYSFALSFTLARCSLVLQDNPWPLLKWPSLFSATIVAQ